MVRQAALIALSGSLVITGGLVALALPAEAADSAAHALAEKFAGASAQDDAKPAPPAATPTIETEAHRLAAEARTAAAEARAAADRLKTEEQEMLEAARAEAVARRAPETPAPAVNGPAAAQEGAIKSVKMTPAARRGADRPPMALGAPMPKDEPAAAEPHGLFTLGRAHAAERVTVVLVMEPGDRGIRRFSKTADPILCVGETCYRSGGAGTPAVSLGKARALSPITAFGARAGACRHSLTCVFRGVELSGGRAMIEPVDLKVLIHDRRPAAEARADSSCRLSAGRLSCAASIAGKGWKAWVVPEALAEQAGPAILAATARTGVASPGHVAGVAAQTK